MSFEEMLTTAAVARVFGVDVSTVSRWVQLDRIPTAGRFGEGRTAAIMFSAADIAEFGRSLAELDTARTTEVAS